jgi:hypothetical protein
MLGIARDTCASLNALLTAKSATEFLPTGSDAHRLCGIPEEQEVSTTSVFNSATSAQRDGSRTASTSSGGSPRADVATGGGNADSDSGQKGSARSMFRAISRRRGYAAPVVEAAAARGSDAPAPPSRGASLDSTASDRIDSLLGELRSLCEEVCAAWLPAALFA